MYNNNNSNPFGEWTGIMPLNENATPQEVDQYNKLFEEYCTDYVSEKEINEYMERLFKHDNVLNEYEERAWWGVSPLEWTKGLSFGGKGGFNIFKPLKWIAIPLLGGVVLLLAGLYKLLQEGKKQIAIARVKAWIEKLVVLADSGYKKTRNTKDSLFLIRQRYRRDILQSAVKVATSLGLDIEEKNTKPESVETSLNESENDEQLTQEGEPEDKKHIEDEHNAVINKDTSLPDDSRVDWSLMNSIKASQWFGLRHKTTNFWKEAKSVGVILDPNNPKDDPVRNCGLIISTISNSLTLVASPGIAQQYASILQKYVQFLTNIDIPDTRNSENYGNTRQDNRFKSINSMNASENIDYNRQKKLYEMFKEDIKIYENMSTEDINVLMNLLQSMPQNTQTQFKQSGLKLEDVNKTTLTIFDMLCQLGQNVKNINYRGENGKINMNPDQIDTYLTVALSKALSTTNFSEWQLHRNAYDQMIKFINELTKTVHTIIDSVAKKTEKLTGGNGAADTLISRFLSSKGDPKQNRSLHNLWDNIGVSKLQQRTIVHCEEIMISPEMQYYLDMFLLTVPAIIKQQLGKGVFTANAKYKQNIEEPKVPENNDANKAAADAVNNIDPKNNVENKKSLENFDPKRFTANKNYNGEEFLFAPKALTEKIDPSKKLVLIYPVNEKNDVFYLTGKYNESNNKISYILNAEKILINPTNLHYMSRLYKIQGHDKIEKRKFYIEHKNNIDGVVDAYSEKMRDDQEVSNDYIDITNLDNNSNPIIYISDDDYRYINEKGEKKEKFNISLELINNIDNNKGQQENNDNTSIDDIKNEDLKNRATEALDGLSKGLQYNRKESEKLVLDVISKYPNLSKEEIIKAALNWDRNTHDYKNKK